jgi:hypothetical protein
MWNIAGRTSPRSASGLTLKKRGNCVEKRNCYICGKEALTKNEIGLTKKLLGRDSKRLYCLDCLAEYLEVDTEFLLAKVEEFREQGCKLF